MYMPIRDYAIIGNAQTVALISSQGAIDWACLPHFDSAAIFLRLLDDTKGGYCAIKPSNLAATRRRYLEASNVLETTFETATGLLVITDFMPIRKRKELHPHGQDTISEHKIVRLIRCTNGSAQFLIEFKPTFGYATEQAKIVSLQDGRLLFKGRKDALYVQCDNLAVQEDGQANATIRLQNGDVLSVVLTYSKPDEHVPVTSIDAVQQALNETQSYWKEWSKTCSYQGAYRDMVLRSALVLKLLTFEPTGAIVAAPTTSLPEEIGGVRNWDYRFSWLRDSAFTLMALMNLGYFGEAHDFLHFLKRTCDCPADELQILYRISGDRLTKEEILAHLDGYRGSKPVRIGNAAADQKQLDIYGELLECIHLYTSRGGSERYHEPFLAELWPTVERTADYVCRHWRDPDSGIWEVRGGNRHFVHSKAMCWVALDCALKLASIARLDKHVADWERERDAIFDSLIHEGFDSRIQAFVQSYGSKALDASILRLPMLGMMEANHPRMRSTIARIEKHLMRNGLIYRYLAVDDGIAGGESTFAICTFWLIDNYVLCGRLKEAEDLFGHMVSFANDVGLLSEEIDPVTGQQLGNFPQAFTHIALINSAVRLVDALERKDASESRR